METFYNIQIPNIDGNDFLKFSTTNLEAFLEHLKVILPIDLEDEIQINISVSAIPLYEVPSVLKAFLEEQWPIPG